MSTLVELFDHEAIKNVFAYDALKCERVVFVGNKELHDEKGRLGAYLSKRGAPEVIFRIIKKGEGEEAVLSEILEKYDNCIIDLTGGSDEMIFAVGKLAERMGVKVIKSDVDCMRIVGIHNSKSDYDAPVGYKISDIIELAGGKIIGGGRFSLDMIYNHIEREAETMMKIFLDYHEIWHKQVRYFQAVIGINSGEYICAPREIGGFICNNSIMNRLYRDGILKTLKINRNKVSFSFAKTQMKSLMCDVGVWLELYVYKAIINSGVFFDSGVSVMIDWDGKREDFNVENEIDVMATKGAFVYFISCKSGPVSVEAVNEISVLCSHFGGEYARAVLVTATKMSQDNICIYKRAAELGVRVIELKDLISGNLEQILTTL